MYNRDVYASTCKVINEVTVNNNIVNNIITFVTSVSIR